MKRFLLFLLACASAQAANITWEVPAFTYSITRPANAGSTCTYQWEGTGGIVNGPSGVFSSGGPGPGTKTGNRNAVTFTTSDTVTAVRLTILVDTTNGAAPIPVFWQQARKVGETTPPKGGPYSGGNPVTPGGDPVDNDGNPAEEPPKRYKAQAAVMNSSNYPITVKEVWTSEGSIIRQKMANVPPQTWYDTGWCYYHKPFTITLTTMVDGQDTADPPVISEGEPVDETDPNEPPIGGPGTPGGPDGPPSGGGGIKIDPIAEPPQITPQPRPGEGEPNTEARHQELLAAVNRVTTAVTNAANQAKGDAAQGNSLLGSIKDAAGKTSENTGEIAENTKGIGDGEGDGEGGEGGEGGTGGSGHLAMPGPGTGGTAGNVPGELSGIGGKISSIRQGAGEALTGAQALVGALGLTQQHGTAPLIWQIPVGPFGNVTLDLDSFASGWIEIVRAILVFVLSIQTAFKAVEILKGAFS